MRGDKEMLDRSWLLALGLLAAVVVPASASAAEPKQGDLTVRVAVKRFQAKNNDTIAKGTATAQFVDNTGHATKVQLPVTLTAKRGGSCRVLTLTLDELKLSLLGLNVDLSKVDLRVTGERRGGILGSLFCKLANAKVKTSTRAAVKRLNARLSKKPIQPLAFSVPLSRRSASASATVPTCPVLNLILGPLHLDLLGLVVDLNKVNLVITATPGGGTLGNLFCTLSK
jgi:hypothetical protein